MIHAAEDGHPPCCYHCHGYLETNAEVIFVAADIYVDVKGARVVDFQPIHPGCSRVLLGAMFEKKDQTI